MPVVRRCPHCGLAVVDRDGLCGHCGQPLRTASRVVTFDHAARIQRESLSSGSDEAPEAPASTAPADGIAESPAAPRDAQINERYDPRILLTLLIPLVPLIVGLTLGRNGAATVGDIASQLLERAGIVWVQYVVLRALSGERMFVAVLVLQLVATVAPGQPSTEDRGLFEPNLILLLAGLQAVGVASFRLWHAPDAGAKGPCPHCSGGAALEYVHRPDRLEPSGALPSLRGDSHADFAV